MSVRSLYVLAYVGKSYKIIKVTSLIGGQFMCREDQIIFASCIITIGVSDCSYKKRDNYK
ncbi:hypothetical protein O3M35_008273 [Rhynocoris fuscipes]|uniref:Uncharacterized protein n=1 Tax=Rhynocoris fuscipes TaxID=488301 RepID=A0AAW1D5Q9_9HEMI